MIKDSATTIVCYGDSNTWGAVPNSNDRYPRSVRWTSVLQNLLGEEYEVISEGLPGRTFVVGNSKKPWRIGITHLQSILESAEPVELVIVMLGTNDVKSTFNLSAEEIAQHLLQTIIFIRESTTLQKIPEILVVCPPPVINLENNDLDQRMVRGIELFQVLPNLYNEVAERNNCSFINAGDYITSSKIDGYHFDADGHRKLAQVIADKIKNTSIKNK